MFVMVNCVNLQSEIGAHKAVEEMGTEATINGMEAVIADTESSEKMEEATQKTEESETEATNVEYEASAGNSEALKVEVSTKDSRVETESSEPELTEETETEATTSKDDTESSSPHVDSIRPDNEYKIKMDSPGISFGIQPAIVILGPSNCNPGYRMDPVDLKCKRVI